MKPETSNQSNDMTGLQVREHAPAALATTQDNGAGSITALLHLAVEKGTPVAELSKLVDLHERMEARQSTKDFADAMARFQAECPSIKKASTAKIVTNGGATFDYTYAELDEIARTVNPILAKHGLSYTWDTSADEKMLTVVCTVRHNNGHSITSSFVLPVESKSAMSAQQKYGAAQTFAQRKSLSAVLGITTTDDDTDGGATTTVKITEDQATELGDLMKETNTQPSRFLKYLKVASLTDLPASDYAHAKTTLERKKVGAM
jgi:uncharacterized protein YndB with AHSA1/START domain